MTDAQTPDPDKATPESGGDAGIRRPARDDANPPAQSREGPASGGEGAAGAGGPDGFGTGT